MEALRNRYRAPRSKGSLDGLRPVSPRGRPPEAAGALSGWGEVWRRDESGEEVTVLTPGVSIDIPVGTAFQYRCTGAEALRFLCITMPPWPGNAEATPIEGPWVPTAPVGPV